MRMIRHLIAAFVLGVLLMFGGQSSAQAFVCNGSPYVDDGGLICKVVYAATGPVCHKYGCG